MNQVSELSQIRQRSHRRGLAYAELLVSAAILSSVLGLMATSVFRIGQVWRDIGHQHIAMEELSNHLERITQMSAESAAQEIGSLEPSEFAKALLPQPEISGTISTDSDLGSRVTLEIDWVHSNSDRGNPLALSAWWPGAEPVPQNNAESDGDSEPEVGQ